MNTNACHISNTIIDEASLVERNDGHIMLAMIDLDVRSTNGEEKKWKVDNEKQLICKKEEW